MQFLKFLGTIKNHVTIGGMREDLQTYHRTIQETIQRNIETIVHFIDNVDALKQQAAALSKTVPAEATKIAAIETQIESLNKDISIMIATVRELNRAYSGFSDTVNKLN